MAFLKRIFFIFICWNLISSNLFAFTKPLSFKHSLNLGRQINSFTQDEDGFFWFATSGGLIRWDGVNTKTYKRGKHSISADYVTDVFDTKNALWILTTIQGLNKYDKKTGQFIYFTQDLKDKNSLNDTGGFSLYVDGTNLVLV